MQPVGETAIAHQFFAGHYAEILAATYDEGLEIEERDVAFVVGALTFVDRVDEARGLANARTTAASEARTVAACRFFLGLAAARAGYFDRSFPLLVTEGFRARHDPDPWVRALAFQGLACQCYFTGRYRGAASHALRALQAAHDARFLWAAMLGTDMRGHSLVQMGQLQRGIRMLEQANTQARRLGLVNNAFAVDTSIATYVTKFDPHEQSLERVEELLRSRRAHDSYSYRALLTEAAVQRALRGRRSDAIEALEAADRDALRGDTRRGRVTSMLARLWVTRWQYGPLACAELVEQAKELVEPRDVAFRAELLAFEIVVARATADREREQRVLGQLRELWRSSHHFAAKSALGQFDAGGRTVAFDEDTVTPVLRAVAQRDTTALSRIVGLGLYGVLPELLGLVPGQRIISIPTEDLLVLEDRGNVIARARPPRWCPVLLRLLASGTASKERIVATMWGLRAYHPEIHDPPVRTTIHRLRTFLRPYSHWIEVSEDGYRTTVPVHVAAAFDVVHEPAPLLEEGHIPTLDPPTPPAVRSDPRRERASVKDIVYERLDELQQASVPQLARASRLSASTVLRALRELVDEQRVERLGFARATRYKVAA
jgi:hypothetical protein